jgi:uncharacterized protein
MYRFETLDDVQSTIQRLTDRQPSLVRVLPRQPGTKESRYMHLLGDVTEDYTPAPAPTQAFVSAHNDSRIAALESEVSSLRKEVAELRQQLSQFKVQFE